MLEEKEVLQVFRQIENLFDQIKKQLFMDEWIRDCTKLLFALVKTEENPKKITFFQSKENGSHIMDEFDTGDYLGYSEQIDNLMYSKLRREDFVKEQLEIEKLNDCSIKMWCICLSPCFAKNRGKMLLRKTFSEFIRSLRGWCMLLEITNESLDRGLQVEAVDNFHEVVQTILENSALEVRRDLEKFYSPIKILYINSLSGEYYEKAECQSNLLFLPPVNPKDIDASKFAYNFRDAKDLENGIAFIPANFRWIRKLVQMAQKHLYLVFQVDQKENVFKVLGICEKENIASLLTENFEEPPYFTVQIRRHMQWDLFLGSAYIFSFQNGEYKINMEMPLPYLTKRCQEAFGGKKEDYEKVAKSIYKSQEQAHGTMIVVLSDNYAQLEVSRLSGLRAGMKDEYPREQVQIINNLNAIDGCVMLDTKGKVHGIGIILDGEKTTECNPARGSRYNSALKYHDYLANHRIPGLILIVSEDGTIEILSTKNLDTNNNI